MSRIAIIAAFVLASTSAFAGDTYDFKIGGQSFHIEQPRDCNAASCVTVSIPGVYESGPKRRRNRPSDADEQANIARDKKDRDIKPAPIDVAPTASSPQPATPNVATAPATSTSNKSLEPANGMTSSPSSRPGATLDAPAAGLAPPVVSSVPPVSTANQPDNASLANSPLGVWLTEEKEGKVRIEACGGNLCGYSVDAKTDANGDKVLINMKPGGGKWTGRIHDPKGGSSYDSTIAMKGTDSLRVQGCAFGGMFCGGQTWTRVN